MKRNRKYRLKFTTKVFLADLIVFIILFMVAVLVTICGYKKPEKIHMYTASAESKPTIISTTMEQAEANKYQSIYINDIQEVTVAEQEVACTDNERYLLAKIAMAEAEGLNTESKSAIIQTVLNRVKSEKFPNNIHDVIFQKLNGSYQFSPIGDGRWNRVEPTEDCYNAVNMALKAKSDITNGALFFESSENKDNWHSKNLNYLCKYESFRFYCFK